jgi:hypothetical protein
LRNSKTACFGSIAAKAIKQIIPETSRINLFFKRSDKTSLLFLFLDHPKIKSALTAESLKNIFEHNEGIKEKLKQYPKVKKKKILTCFCM